MTRTILLLLTTSLLQACGGDDGGGDSTVDGGVDPGPFAPDSFCPGSEGCAAGGDGVLHVGAAAVEITATVDDTTDVQTVDVNGDGEYSPEDGDEFDDRNGNGKYDGVWMAGFGNARGATGVNDPQWVRSVALRNGETTVVLAAIDCVGYFKDEMDMIREMVADVDVDYVMLASTHVHQARDTLGIYGISEAETGISPEYMAFVREQAAESIRQAVAALRPSHVQYASFRLRDLPGGVSRYVGDNRDPNIIDDEVRVIRFAEASSGDTISTLVSWASHPEYAGPRNTLLSSDYPHWLREGLENGVAGPDGAMADGLGGVAVFFSAALGGQIGPNDVEFEAWDAMPVEEDTLRSAEVIGSQIAWHVLDALGDGGGSVTDETAELGFRNRSFFVDVQNRGYHVALLSDLFVRQSYNWDPDLPLMAGENEPDVRTEVAVIDIGRAQLMTIPGELHPELFVGGYDGSFTPEGQAIVHPDNENPPELTMAPDGPYLRDLAREDAEYVIPIGLGNDMVGYLVPEYNYQLHPSNPYLDEPPGDHYEETNSVGIDGWPTIQSQLTQLLAWSPEE